MTKKLTPKLVDNIICYSEDVASDYADYPDSGFDLTDEYAKRSFWVSSRNRLFSWLVHRERKRLGEAKLLDVGCGTGDFAQHLSDDSSVTVTGSEIYLKGLQYAKKRQPHIEFIQYDVTEGILDRTYDIITAFDVLEHIEEDVVGMRNVHEMLTDRGVFILSVPQHTFLWSKLDEIVCHKRRYSRSDMLDKLRQAGFTPVRVTSHVFTLFPLMYLSRRMDKSKPSVANTQEASALSDRVTFSRGVNWIFNKIMYIDEALVRCGISLPFGGTLVVVARKKSP